MRGPPPSLDGVSILFAAIAGVLLDDHVRLIGRRASGAFAPATAFAFAFVAHEDIDSSDDPYRNESSYDKVTDAHASTSFSPLNCLKGSFAMSTYRSTAAAMIATTYEYHSILVPTMDPCITYTIQATKYARRHW